MRDPTCPGTAGARFRSHAMRGEGVTEMTDRMRNAIATPIASLCSPFSHLFVHFKHSKQVFVQSQGFGYAKDTTDETSPTLNGFVFRFLLLPSQWIVLCWRYGFRWSNQALFQT